MAATLGSKAIGSIVKIPVNGADRDFIVVHQGKPSIAYDNSFNGGTILLQRYLYEYRVWNTDGINDYANSSTNNYLNSTYLNMIDPAIQSRIKQVKIPYRPGEGLSTYVYTGSNGLAVSVFHLSCNEVGAGGSNQHIADEGAVLSYFNGAGSWDNQSEQRKAYLHQGPQQPTWSLRSPNVYNINPTYAWFVLGVGSLAIYATGNTGGYDRPAIVLPDTMLVYDDGSLTNTVPTVPSSVTIPSSINGGTTITLSWGASSDAEGNLAGYYAEISADGGSAWNRIYQGTLTNTTYNVPYGTPSFMARAAAYDSEGLTSAWKTSSQVTVINNTAPSAPANINVPVLIQGGGNVLVSCDTSTDPEGNPVTYVFERAVNSGSFIKIYEGPNTFYSDIVAKGINTVQYRVCAKDDSGAASAYTASPVRAVDNSIPAVILGPTVTDLGTKDDAFDWQYTITQEDDQNVTVVEKMDGVTMRTYTAALGSANTFSVPLEYFITLSNGPHTMTVTVTTAQNKVTVFTVTFIKAVYVVRVTLGKPLPADGLITQMVMDVTRNIPPDGAFQALVTNNANDTPPAWEDATQAVINKTKYLFANTTVANGNAFNFDVSANRGPSNQGGSISAITGAFQGGTD
ncbi:MAG: DUF6273 domain-containing protein [Clostridiales bacterium]|nr:DUF6273 domain-containing protein [Clostridiales bacterium]